MKGVSPSYYSFWYLPIILLRAVPGAQVVPTTDDVIELASKCPLDRWYRGADLQTSTTSHYWNSDQILSKRVQQVCHKPGG